MEKTYRYRYYSAATKFKKYMIRLYNSPAKKTNVSSEYIPSKKLEKYTPCAII